MAKKKLNTTQENAENALPNIANPEGEVQSIVSSEDVEAIVRYYRENNIEEEDLQGEAELFDYENEEVESPTVEEINQSVKRLNEEQKEKMSEMIASAMSVEDDDDEKKKKAPPMFFLFKGNGPGVNYKSIKKWDKSEYFNGVQNVYAIVLTHYDMDETIIEYFDIEARDVEYENFLDKLRELGYILM